MKPPSLLPDDEPLYDEALLRTLRGSLLSLQLQVLCVIGAHRFDELALINRLFPSLRALYLFEPQAEPLEALYRVAGRDPRIKVFPVAVSDTDGTASFHVASNAGESSSLLQLGSHRRHFPHVTMQQSIEVPTRRLDSVLAEHRLELPDAMIVDVQGAEYMVLKSFPADILDHLRLIYTEVSTEAVYESAGLLPQVEDLLAPRFVNLGFAAINAAVPMHGNAVFVARPDVGLALAMTRKERPWRASPHVKRYLRKRGARLEGRR